MIVLWRVMDYRVLMFYWVYYKCMDVFGFVIFIRIFFFFFLQSVVVVGLSSSVDGSNCK